MTELSPAALAVANAYTSTPIKSGIKSPLAAALRVAADEVAPFPGRYPMNEYMEGFRDAKQSVRLQLIAIARELEGRR
jgi:hypothetical protein